MFENQEMNRQFSVVSFSSSRLLKFLMLGFVLIFVGIVVLVIAAFMSGGGSGNVGGVIFIGPFPIVFGAGPDSGWLILISIVLTVIMLSSFFILYFRKQKIMISG